jgi:hypothetical protein
MDLEIKSLRDIPFPYRDLEDLLVLSRVGEHVRKPLKDDVRYGFGFTEQIRLISTKTGYSEEVKQVLLIALHSSEDPNPYENDIDVEFALTDLGWASQDYFAPLTRFLELRFEEIQMTFEAVIMVVCNFEQRTLSFPPCMKSYPVYYAKGEVTSFINVDHDEYGQITWVDKDSLRLEAKQWIKWQGDSTDPISDQSVSSSPEHPSSSSKKEYTMDAAYFEEQKLIYAGMWVLKMLDIGPKQGGLFVEVPLPPEYDFAEEIFDYLIDENLIFINEKKACYDLTDEGMDYIRRIIHEAEALVDEFQDEELEDMLEELEERHIDLLRSRFLWGLYHGEFDNVVLFQQQRGMQPVERNWARFITSNEFFENLMLDLEIDDEEEDSIN